MVLPGGIEMEREEKAHNEIPPLPLSNATKSSSRHHSLSYPSSDVLLSFVFVPNLARGVHREFVPRLG